MAYSIVLIGSIVASIVCNNFAGVFIKGSLLGFETNNEWVLLGLHIIISSYSGTISESVCTSLVILTSLIPTDKHSYCSKAFLQLILILLLSGLFTKDITLLLPQLVCLILSYSYSFQVSTLAELKQNNKRIIEENKIYTNKLGELRNNLKYRKSSIKRSATLLSKLKMLRLPKSFNSEEFEDNTSPASEFECPSRKSSIDVVEFNETPKSSSMVDSEHILERISNDEIKEIINTLISQKYLMWNPDKCGESEIDVISLALKAKKVFTQSIENLPGSSHTLINLNKLKRLETINSMIEVSEPLTEVLESIGEWDFNCFELIKVTKDPAFEVGLYIFNTLNLNERFSIENSTLKKFLTSVEHGYNRSNFYHNSIHAADVTASTLFLIQKGLSRCRNLVDLDVFALVVAAICHDIGHPGLNNAFLVATGHELSFKYNDQSCLENMHCNKSFVILNTEGCRIAEYLSKADYQRFRKNMVLAILSTDLQVHFDKLVEFKVHLGEKRDISDDKFRTLAIQMCLKCADIGHGARKLDIHMKWSALIIKEFFKQGLLEKEHGIPITPLCDIENCIISKSQVGFLEVLVKPLFQVWEEFVEQNNEEDSELEVKICLQNINENIEFWNNEFLLYQQGNPTFCLDSDPPPIL